MNLAQTTVCTTLPVHDMMDSSNMLQLPTGLPALHGSDPAVRVQRQVVFDQLDDLLGVIRRTTPFNTSATEVHDLFIENVPRLQSLIAAAEATLVHIRTLQNNTFSHIHHLPPELLTHIFANLVSTTLSHVDLISATHVCRSWRAIALDSPELWTELIGLADISKARAFINRSKHLPLHVHMKRSLPPDVGRKLSNVVLTLSIRLRTLVIEVEHADKLATLINHMTSLSAPLLRTLHLLVDPEGDQMLSEPDKMGDGVDIFGADGEPSHAPPIRSLRIHRICIPWTSSLYKDLSILEVKLARYQTRLPSQKRLLEILGQCPALTYLHLATTNLRSPRVPDDDPAWLVSLPILSTIILEDMSPATIRGLLSHLSLPSATRYSFETHEDGNGLFKIFPSDTSRLHGIGAYHRVELAGCIDEDWALLECYHESIGGLGDPLLSLRVRASAMLSPLRSVLESLDVSSAKIFVASNMWLGLDRVYYADDDEEDQASEWDTLFTSCNELRALRFVYPTEHSEFAIRAFNALADPRGVGDDLQERGWMESLPPCTQLREIELVSVDSLKPIQDALLHACRRRKESGFPLARLELLEVDGVSQEVVQQLRELVSEVVVNDSEP